jgi:DNA-binding NarL/FixJ family response regulator
VIAAGVPLASSHAHNVEVVESVAPERDEVRRALAAARPDVLLLRLRSADPDGIAIIRQAGPTPVLAVAEPGANDLIIAAMRAGARGLIHHDAGPADLIRAIHAVAGGAAVFGADAAEHLYGHLAAPARAFPELTDREYEVLGLLADDLDNRTIADLLNLAPKTVRNLVSGVLAKLGAPDRATAAAQARHAGLGRAV